MMGTIQITGEDAIALLTRSIENGMPYAGRDVVAQYIRADETEIAQLRAAVLSMRSLWPVERWATLSGICADHPCIPKIAIAAEAAGEGK